MTRVVNKLETSLTDDARVIIYDCHMFIVQAIGVHALIISPLVTEAVAWSAWADHFFVRL